MVDPAVAPIIRASSRCFVCVGISAVPGAHTPGEQTSSHLETDEAPDGHGRADFRSATRPILSSKRTKASYSLLGFYAHLRSKQRLQVCSDLLHARPVRDRRTAVYLLRTPSGDTVTPDSSNATPLIPQRRSAQIDPRGLGSVSLAVNGPTGQF
jgi:hypothetical protein